MKKIKEITRGKFCNHPSHNPPNMIVLEEGCYEHVCPKCGNKKIVYVGPKPTM
jgi:hypothetical protein